jgi:TonB-dependent SusC/RagA subfamily outer membrane receptor
MSLLYSHQRYSLLVGLAVLATPQLRSASAQSPRASSDSVALLPATRVPVVNSGASVAVIDSAEIAASGARTLSELLLARVPGLSVRRLGGAEADGVEISSRGMIAGTGVAPMLIIDGVIADAQQALRLPGTSVAPSRFDDLTPADVQRIEVLRGPAASALYGFGAAPGVIVVTTRRGGAGPLRLGMSGSVGLTDMRAKFPANYQLTNGTPGQACNPRLVPANTVENCAPLTLYSWNPLEQASPFHTGQTLSGGATLSGTTRGVRLFGGVSAERERGVTDDDRQSRIGLHGSAERSLPGHVTVSAQAGYVQRGATAPARGDPDLFHNVTARGMLGSAYDDSVRGYWQPIPTLLVQPAEPSLSRATGALRLGWEPRAWLSVDALAGRDRSSESALATSMSIGTFGTSASSRLLNDQWMSGTMHVGAMTRYVPRANVSMSTYLAYDDVRSHDRTLDSTAFGDMFTSMQRAWRRTRLQEATVRQHVAWGDRLYVNAGARFSVGRGIAAPFGAEASRNADASLRLPSPRPGIELRLRGAAGIVPLVPPGLRYLAQNPDAYGFISRPLRSRQGEREGGLDADFGVRAHVRVTWFKSEARDIPLGGDTFVVSPTGAAPLLFDLSNSGIEAVASAQLLNGARLGWHSTVAAATLHGNVTHFDGPLVSSNGRLVSGHPLQGYWSPEYRAVDANGDGLIAKNEVTLGPYSTYVGPSQPTLEVGFQNILTIPHGITLSALMDYRHGQYRDNATETLRCRADVCKGVNDVTLSLTDQARWSAISGKLIKDVVPASYLRLREVVLEWSAPTTRARPLAARVVGQNLLMWTEYDGSDPEVGSISLNAASAPSDFFQSPLPSRVRVEVRMGVM